MSVRLLPATSYSLMGKRLALLLYAMCKGLAFNVGWVIHDEMLAITNPIKKNQVIRFPSLITALCKKAGLKATANPAEQVPLIGNLIWKKFEKQRPAHGGASSSGRP